MAIEVMTIVLYIVAAAIFAGAQYMRKHLASGEPFDVTKFVTTLVVGFFIGAISAFTGIVPSPETIESQLLLYGGLTVIVENVVKIIINAIVGGQQG